MTEVEVLQAQVESLTERLERAERMLTAMRDAFNSCSTVPGIATELEALDL